MVIAHIRVRQRVLILISRGPAGLSQRLMALRAMGRKCLRFVGIRGHIFGRPRLDGETMICVAIRASVFAERTSNDARLHADHKGNFDRRNRCHFAWMN